MFKAGGILGPLELSPSSNRYNDPVGGGGCGGDGSSGESPFLSWVPFEVRWGDTTFGVVLLEEWSGEEALLTGGGERLSSGQPSSVHGHTNQITMVRG